VVEGVRRVEREERWGVGVPAQLLEVGEVIVVGVGVAGIRLQRGALGGAGDRAVVAVVEVAHEEIEVPIVVEVLLTVKEAVPIRVRVEGIHAPADRLDPSSTVGFAK